MLDLGMFICGFVLGGILVGAVFVYWSEKADYGDGKCNCGGSYYCFDTDSWGGELWKCTSCNKWFPITWKSITKHHHQNNKG